MLVADVGGPAIGDPRDVDTSEPVLAGEVPVEQPDAIVHLAAQSSVALSWQDPELTYRVNYGGEVSVTMADDGTGQDALAGDGVFTATIPASALAPEAANPEDGPGGVEVRWRARAEAAPSRDLQPRWGR